jgi:hypothetical protein
VGVVVSLSERRSHSAIERSLLYLVKIFHHVLEMPNTHTDVLLVSYFYRL